MKQQSINLQEHEVKLTYRPDIDGLRAVAVLAVILYHLDIKPFTGGFVGVDVFFVISGYLITTIIMREIDEHQFSLVQFYERRIRRIFPALFVVLFATSIVSVIMFTATELKAFGQSLVATALFVSNMLFWSESGYFDAPSTFKPLLHTWSLAVEEQYYIFFPLFLVFLAKYFRPALKFILLGIAVASFLFSVRYLRIDASGTFYFVHTRLWELLIGSLLAGKLLPARMNLTVRNLLGVLGLAVIAAPLFFYTNGTAFPGRAALLPTLGAALIIYSGMESQTLVGRLLSFRPVVFIGKISYSLYLWHWPVIVFAKYYAILELKPYQIVAVALLIFILSVVSWQFVEKPFREKRLLQDRRIFGYAASATVLMLICGAVIYLQEGFPSRFVTIDVKNSPAYKEVQMWMQCTPPDNVKDPLYESKFCHLGKDTTNQPTFLLLGDSHSRAIAPGVQAAASKAGVAGMFVFKPTCPPLTGVYVLSVCNEFVERIMSYIRKHPNLHTIILVSRWAIYADGSTYKNELGDPVILLSDKQPDLDQTDNNPRLFKFGLTRTVEKLLNMGRSVIIVNEIPEIGYNVPAAFSIAQRTGADINNIIAPSLDEYIARNTFPASVIQSLSKRKNVQVLDPSRILCAQARCLVAVDGQYLYTDDDHLSIFGAQYISSIFDGIFENSAGNETK